MLNYVADLFSDLSAMQMMCMWKKFAATCATQNVIFSSSLFLLLFLLKLLLSINQESWLEQTT